MKHHHDLNFKTNDLALGNTFGNIEWIPVIDVCSDTVGSNSTAVLCYNVMVNGLLQMEYFAAKDSICNPPFASAGKYIKMLEEAYKTNNETRVLLIVTARTGTKWFKKLSAECLWRLVETYTKHANSFTEVNN